MDLAARILDGSSDAIVVCDRHGRIHLWNQGARRIFGFDRAEAVGASLDLIIPERFRARHWAGWHSALSAGHTRYAAGQLLAVPASHKNGSRVSIEFSIQFLAGDGGEIEWVAAIIRDVTERYQRDKAMQAELAALRPAKQAASITAERREAAAH